MGNTYIPKIISRFCYVSRFCSPFRKCEVNKAYGTPIGPRVTKIGGWGRELG